MDLIADDAAEMAIEYRWKVLPAPTARSRVS